MIVYEPFSSQDGQILSDIVHCDWLLHYLEEMYATMNGGPSRRTVHRRQLRRLHRGRLQQALFVVDLQIR